MGMRDHGCYCASMGATEPGGAIPGDLPACDGCIDGRAMDGGDCPHCAGTGELEPSGVIPGDVVTIGSPVATDYRNYAESIMARFPNILAGLAK